MRTEDIRQAYDELRPDEDRKAAMLGNILAAEPSKEVTPPKRGRRWLVPALGAAAALVCVLSLPQGQPEAEAPPERPLLQSAPPPMMGAAAPALVAWEGRSYRIDPAAPAPETGELLEQRGTDALYTIPGEDPAERLALVRGDAVLLCLRAETALQTEGDN